MNKDLIVIGLQHSCSRFTANILSKYPDLKFKNHFSIPSDLIGNPFFLFDEPDKFFDNNTIVVFSDRDLNYVLHSNDNTGNSQQWNEICNHKNSKHLPLSNNIIKNYQIIIKKLINEIFKPKNIKYYFFSISSYLLNDELYLENFINQMNLDYNKYPKNLQGYYRINNFDKLDPNNLATKFIKPDGTICDLEQHNRSQFQNIKLQNNDEKYYKNKKYWDNKGNLKL